jgi:hypothetical protein
MTLLINIFASVGMGALKIIISSLQSVKYLGKYTQDRARKIKYTREKQGKTKSK